MNDPVIADTKPMVLELEAGNYWWCSCGQSKNQPFCDGSHQGTSFTPLKFSIPEKKQVAICNCKSSGNPPFCDGSHTKV